MKSKKTEWTRKRQLVPYVGHETMDTSVLEPTDWGWKKTGKTLTPIATDNEVAPAQLLKFVRCKCKISTKNPCGTNICSCRKYGMACVAACGDCRGENCCNTSKVDEPLENENDPDCNANIFDILSECMNE